MAAYEKVALLSLGPLATATSRVELIIEHFPETRDSI